MNTDEKRTVVKRLDGIWPPRNPPTVEERHEWVKFLQPLESDVALDAIDIMRESVMFRPSMADFMKYYHEAAAIPRENALQLPAGDDDATGPSLQDIYGSHQDDWIYCWKCDMAISMDDVLDEKVRYDGRRGLCHGRCPKSGSAPAMPVHLRIARQEYWTKHKITATP